MTVRRSPIPEAALARTCASCGKGFQVRRKGDAGNATLMAELNTARDAGLRARGT